MTGNTVHAAEAAYRKKRVKRIKKIIVGTAIVLLLLPTIMCLFLLVKVHSLEKQIETITKVSDSGVVKAQEKEVKTTKAPKKASTAEPTIKPTDDTTTKKVYLTFDDGPGSQTGEILDILKKNHVKATFFVTGKEDPSSKKIYQRIVKEGHTLAMHSYSHIQDVIYDSKEAFEKDLKQINRCLYEATGVHTKFYRFPGGSSTQNTSLPIQNFIDVLKKNHYLYLDWNVISPDINNANATKEQVVTGVMQGVDAYDTAVVLMYDVADKPMTVKALPSIIKQIKAKNYELLPVDESMILIQHNNGNQEEGK
ncbi:MAG: polysaccharide deacetylase family protein [Eubacterium sp.]|nr:polysaccharide deacetylase family protein [Eubacterium sp.]